LTFFLFVCERQKKRAELADGQAMNTIATLNTQHRELQKKIAKLYKVIDKFRRKYPRSGISVPKRTAMLLDFDDVDDDNDGGDDDNNDDDNEDDDDNDNDEPPKAKGKGKAKEKAKVDAKAAKGKKQAAVKNKSPATPSKKRKKGADDADATKSDEGDISLSPVARAASPPITRSAIRKNASRGAKKPSLSSQRASKATPSKSAAAAAAAAKKASGNSAAKSNEAADNVASDVVPDKVVKIVRKSLAYDLPIYQVLWSNNTTSLEFACDLNAEGYRELLSRFEADWGTRPVPVLNPKKWPRNYPADGVVAEKITDIGFCKGDISVLVKWVGLPLAESTWERVTDMMVYGFGDLVNAFRKQWGDRPIEHVYLDTAAGEVEQAPAAGIKIKTEGGNRAAEQIEAAVSSDAKHAGKRRGRGPPPKRGRGRPRKIARKDTDATASSSVASTSRTITMTTTRPTAATAATAAAAAAAAV
jgi:hypothetical protein